MTLSKTASKTARPKRTNERRATQHLQNNSIFIFFFLVDFRSTLATPKLCLTKPSERERRNYPIFTVSCVFILTRLFASHAVVAPKPKLHVIVALETLISSQLDFSSHCPFFASVFSSVVSFSVFVHLHDEQLDASNETAHCRMMQKDNRNELISALFSSSVSTIAKSRR